MKCSLFIVAAVIAHCGEVDRRVAEFTLLMGGRVEVAGRAGRIADAADLPRGDFLVTVLDWVGMNVDPPDLERLTGLAALKELHLPGPIWNRNADGGKNRSAELKYLSGLTTLEVLTFSYHFLDRIRFTDAGLAEIAALKNLHELAIRQTSIKGASLAPFVNLHALDLTLTPFDDSGLAKLASMTRMKRLWIGDTLVTDSSARALATMTELEDLDLHGTAITDAALAQVARLRSLKRINLMGTDVSDAGLRQLSALTNLEELNLYRTRVSNAGLDALRGLTKLRYVDLRYSRVTARGAATLAASHPTTKFLLMDASPRPRPVIAANTRAAEWIRKIGGRVENGAVSLASTAVADGDLARLGEISGLREINIEGTEIGDAGAKLLPRTIEILLAGSTSIGDEGLAGFAKLRKARLANTYVEGPGLRALTAAEEIDLHGAPVGNNGVDALAELPKLRVLSLASTDIGDGAALEKLTRLLSLNLAATDLTDAGVGGLAHLTGLKTLVLRDARITGKALGALGQMAGLEELDLSRTRIAGPDLKSLAGLRQIRRLNLDYGEIEDAAIVHLAALPTLEALSLDSTHITDAAVPELIKLDKLRLLNLYHTHVTAKGRDAIAKALPHCKIVWDAASSLPNRRRS
ncbi:MAG: hypothetical protein FJW38_00260 [Acidobacteria bacterium]|nr:hypothetical protein [Acidobacteriota bacterium]